MFFSPQGKFPNRILCKVYTHSDLRALCQMYADHSDMADVLKSVKLGAAAGDATKYQAINCR